MRRYGTLLLVLGGILTRRLALGQLDPEYRESLQMGFEQALLGASPIDGYGYYYLNEPNFFHTNVTLRLTLAPVYVDSETGFAGLLGPHTDFGLGLAGGGFADDYYEFRDGQYLPNESFLGHVLQASASVYHLFNPGDRIPLYGVLRVTEHYSIYGRDDTASTFVLPPNHSTIAWRAGLRLGGHEPVLRPDLAMELSAWYEGQYRTDAGSYDFDGDRVLASSAELFWARALLIYTFTNSRQSFAVNLTGGSSIDPDRFSAYRLGGGLPMMSEFPLVIPGYYTGELSARNFACFTADYKLPLDAGKRWSLNPVGAVATVDYLPALEQPGHFNSGVGLGLGYRARSGNWQAVASYGYGFEAIRSHGRGGQTIGIVIEINLGASHPNGPSALDHAVGFLQNNL